MKYYKLTLLAVFQCVCSQLMLPGESSALTIRLLKGFLITYECEAVHCKVSDC